MCFPPAQLVLSNSSVTTLESKMAIAQQAVRRRRHPMSVRRRRHTHTSCNYTIRAYYALKCRRERCDNDSPRGGPRAGRPSRSIHQDGPSARTNVSCIGAPPTAVIHKTPEPGCPRIIPMLKGTTKCGCKTSLSVSRRGHEATPHGSVFKARSAGSCTVSPSTRQRL